MFSDIIQSLGSGVPDLQVEALTSAQNTVLLWSPQSSSTPPTHLLPHILAAVAGAAGLPIPGESLCSAASTFSGDAASGGGGASALDDFGGGEESSEERVISLGLELLYTCLDVTKEAQGAAARTSMLATPGALRILFALVDPQTGLSDESTARAARILNELATSHPRTFLRAGGLRAIVSAALASSQLALRDPTLSSIEACADVGASSRADAASAVDALAPLVRALREEYRFTARGARLVTPSGLQLTAVPALLVGGAAGRSFSHFVSTLSATATGHWRAWDDAYAARAPPATVPRVPANWAHAALTDLVDAGILYIWAAALAAHAAAAGVADDDAPALEVTGTRLASFLVPEAALAPLVAALARVVKVLQIADALGVGGGAGGRVAAQLVNDCRLAHVLSLLLGAPRERDHVLDAALVSAIDVLV